MTQDKAQAAGAVSIAQLIADVAETGLGPGCIVAGAALIAYHEAHAAQHYKQGYADMETISAAAVDRYSKRAEAAEASLARLVKGIAGLVRHGCTVDELGTCVKAMEGGSFVKFADLLALLPAKAESSNGMPPQDMASRMQRLGKHVMEFATEGGWQDDGEGAFEFIQRQSYAVGISDAGKTPPSGPRWGNRWPIDQLEPATPAPAMGEELPDDRAAFEVWASDPVRAAKLPLDRWPGNDGYKSHNTYCVYYGWKSARACMALRPPGAVLAGDYDALRSQWAAVDKEIGGKAVHVLAFDDGVNVATPAAPVSQPAAQEAVGYADPQAFLNFAIERQHNIGGPYAKEWMWAKPDTGLVPLYIAPPSLSAPAGSEQEGGAA